MIKLFIFTYLIIGLEFTLIWISSTKGRELLNSSKLLTAFILVLISIVSSPVFLICSFVKGGKK